MQRKVFMVVIAVLAVIGCRDRESSSLTGTYGASVVSGQVVMANGSSPSGVTVTYGGLTTTTDDEGRFTFLNAPAGGSLNFRRAADGIDASLKLAGVGGGPINVELSANGAHTGRSRATNGPRPLVVEGVVKTVSATQLVVTDEKNQDVTFVVTKDTVVKRDDQPQAAGSLAAGMHVKVFASVNNDVKTAILVVVDHDDGNQGGEGENEDVSGKVTAVGTSSITVGTIKVNVDANTVIRKGGVQVKLDAIKVGDEVKAYGKKVADGILAKAIEVRASEQPPTVRPAYVKGKVTAVGASSITVGAIKVNVDANTIIRKDDARIGLDGIKVGDEVSAYGKKIDDTTILAQAIEVHGAEGETDNEVAFKGKVTATGASQITVSTERGAVKVTVDAKTVIKKQGASIGLDGIKVGDEVGVYGKKTADGTVLAEKIEVRGSSGRT